MNRHVDPDSPKLIEVAAGLWVRQEVDNIAWIDMGDWAIVVDALERAELKGEVFAAIDKTLGGEGEGKAKKVRYVLNTHTHYDHTALNDAFARAGAEIVNARTVKLAPEGKWFEGSRRVGMFAAPGCHTAEDCIVTCPDDSALFVGDIFGWGLIPTELTERTRPLLLETYQRLIDYEAETVIPGHGPLCTTTELRRWVEYFNWLCEEISARVGASAHPTEKEILRELAPPEDMAAWWRFLDWKHADSVGHVLRAVRAGRLGSV